MVDWQVAIAEPLLVDGVTPEGFNTYGNDDYARYTSDMKKVIKAFEKSNRKKRHKLYLFFVSATQGDRSGYMPLAGEYGFIFNFGSNTNVIGHELAHGAFNLRHTFSDKAQYHLPERTTLNLMDYANGTELWKYQWDLIHNPETILLGAYNEEEGAMTDDVFWINYFSRNITIHPDYTIGNDNLNYITPAGKPFVLPMSASVSFSGSFTKKSTNSSEQVAIPRGVLYAFADETGTYYANLTKKNGGQYYFNGYLKVVAGAAEAFSAIHKALKAKEARLLVLCMDRSALLMGRQANHVETIRSLCVSVPDVGELEKVLKKLHDMAPDDCAKFLDDLATQNLLCCR